MSDIKKRKELTIPALIAIPLPLFHKDFPIVFFWNPKCGCTSLIKWFYYQIGVLEEANKYGEWIHSYRESIYENQPNHLIHIKDELLDGKKEIYKLIRNPYRRAVSAYFTALAKPEIMDQIAPHFKNGCSFRQFIYRLKEIGVEREVVNSHVAQQYIKDEELFIQNYIKLGNFNTEIRGIEKKYKLLHSPLEEITQSFHHVSQKMTQNVTDPFADVNLFSCIESSEFPPFQNFYDDETKRFVFELYETDFIMLGYDPENLI